MVTKEEIAKKIKRYLLLKIGTNLYINEVNQIKGTNKWEVAVGVSVPRVIYDDDLQKQYIKFIKFDNIYVIEFEINKEGEISTVCNPDAIYDKLSQRHTRIINNVENIILDEIYPKLIRVSLIKNNLRMVYVILNNIYSQQKMTQEEIERYPKKERLKKYLLFLEQYGIIRKNSEGDYVEGNIPIELQKALKDKNEIEVLEYTFGYVLKDGRKYLKEELNLKMLDTFIEIATTYYYLAARIGKLISIDNNTFLYEFEEIYDRSINSSKFLGYLTELQAANVINKRNNMYSGDDVVLHRIEKSFI